MYANREGIRILLALLERVGGDGVVGAVGPLDGKLRVPQAIAKGVARLARVVLVCQRRRDTGRSADDTIQH